MKDLNDFSLPELVCLYGTLNKLIETNVDQFQEQHAQSQHPLLRKLDGAVAVQVYTTNIESLDFPEIREVTKKALQEVSEILAAKRAEIWTILEEAGQTKVATELLGMFEITENRSSSRDSSELGELLKGMVSKKRRSSKKEEEI